MVPSHCLLFVAGDLLGGATDTRVCGGGLDDEGNTSSRSLGLVVARGTLLVLISPTDGSEEIANPFVQDEGA